MKFRNQIKTLRESRGWDQRGLAARLGVSPSAVALWETGANKISLDNLLALADLFGCSVDLILDRENPNRTSA